MSKTRGGRRAKHAAIEAAALSSANAAIQQLAWQPLRYADAPVEPLDEAGVQAIHATAMRILEDIGIDFLHEQARAQLKAAGCIVDGVTVRMDRAFVMAQIAKAPASFTITPRNPARAITVDGAQALFGTVGSPPNVSDLKHGRRTGNHHDYQNLLRLAQSFNCIHFISGYPVEPVDLHPAVRHLDAIQDKLLLTDKVVHAYCLGEARVEDAMQMARIAAGLTQAQFDAQPRMFSNINSSSPLKHDWPMLDGAMRFARHGQPVIVAPFTLAGAMAPITLAGAVAQQTAEGLAAIALLQWIAPGAPVVYGSFTSNVDMRSGAPAFGTPEYMRATQMSGQMARFYRLPLRASNANAANHPDSQAMWESCNSLYGALSAHTSMVYHAAGWLEGGLCASFEKFVMDCEVIQQWMRYHRPVPVGDDDLAFDAIKQVGPHGHFLGCEHTQARYQSAFYKPFLSDWQNFERWEEAGAKRIEQRAAETVDALLDAYQPPPIDPAIREALTDFVARRKAEGGAPTDF